VEKEKRKKGGGGGEGGGEAGGGGGGVNVIWGFEWGWGVGGGDVCWGGGVEGESLACPLVFWEAFVGEAHDRRSEGRSSSFSL